MILSPRAFSSAIRWMTLCIRRRAAKGRAAVDRRNQGRGVAADAGDRPAAPPMRLLAREFSTAGLDLAIAGAQVGAEPRDHDRDAFEVRARACNSSSEAITSERACATWRFSGAELAGPERPHQGRRLVAELGGAGDQRHRAHHLLEPPDRPHDLERQLRNAVAEVAERQPLEHDVGEPAIGRRVAAPSFATISGSAVWSRRRCRCGR